MNTSSTPTRPRPGRGRRWPAKPRHPDPPPPAWLGLPPGPGRALAVLRAEIERRGVWTYHDGEVLIVSAPPGVLTPPLVAAIDRHWDALAAAAPRVPPTLSNCWLCDGSAFWSPIGSSAAYCVACTPPPGAPEPP